jgi:hypothetical protein
MFPYRSGSTRWVVRLSLILAATTVWVTAAKADPPSLTRPRTVFKLPTPDIGNPSPDSEHPVLPVLRMAVDGYRQLRATVRDYTCIMVRRERVHGRLGNHEFIYAKVRHRQMQNGQVIVPFGVYLKFLKPASVAGREVLYVEGKYNGEMLARRGGTRFAFVTTRLRPDSELAMQGNRYPITEFGIENLLRRLIESARDEMQYPSQVEYVHDATINGRLVDGIIVTHTETEPRAPYFQAKIFVDDELQVPVHYESYDWPKTAGGEPVLTEQYTYLKLQLNAGLTDLDFDESNPQYQVR